MSAWAARSGASALPSALRLVLLLIGTIPPGSAWAKVRDASVTVQGRPEGLPIRSVIVVPRSIYDPLPPGRLRPLYRLANGLHVRSRPGTVQSRVLIAPGDVWTLERGRETARSLRASAILEPVRIEAREVRDSVDVVIETRDEWSTQAEFAIESASGQDFTAFSLLERNAFGHGKELQLGYRETPEGVVRSAGVQDPHVGGSRIHAGFEAGTGSEGAYQDGIVELPFYSEDARTSFGVRWSRATSVAHLFQDGQERAFFDRRVEETELRWGRGNRTRAGILRVSGLFLVKDRRFGPSRILLEAPEAFQGGEENLRLRRLAIETRLWRPSYTEWRGVDRLGGIEDIDLGTSVRVGLGYSPHLLGTTSDEGFGSARFDGALRVGSRSFALGSAELASRYREAPEEAKATLQARCVSQHWSGHTEVLSAYGSFLHRPARDQQEILGGLSGLRAFPVRALVGQQAWRFNAEHRWLVGHELFELVSLGTVAFYDTGRTWGPGADPGGWRQDVGFGFRLGLPRSGLDRVARLDVAWPIGPGSAGRPVFSFGSGQAF